MSSFTYDAATVTPPLRCRSALGVPIIDYDIYDNLGVAIRTDIWWPDVVQIVFDSVDAAVNGTWLLPIVALSAFQGNFPGSYTAAKLYQRIINGVYVHVLLSGSYDSIQDQWEIRYIAASPSDVDWKTFTGTDPSWTFAQQGSDIGGFSVFDDTFDNGLAGGTGTAVVSMVNF